MAGAFEIVMNERRELVDRIIKMMQEGEFFRNTQEWDRTALSPQNPLSNVKYKGGNRMKLMATVVARHYKDPRWATARQFMEKGFHIRKGEHGVLCEKWIFTKEKKVTDDKGNVHYETVDLEHPQVSYFRVFNAEQVEGFPSFEADVPKTPVDVLSQQLIDTSECPVELLAQERAYYSPVQDRIILPLRSQFKDDVSFTKTLLHEMSHSSGHISRLNRDMTGNIGSEQYAREELRAEIGALFTESDLGITLNAEHYEDHSDYLRSWIRVLKDDYNEFFRACADAQKISDRLVRNYCLKYELERPEHVSIGQMLENSDRNQETIMKSL